MRVASTRCRVSVRGVRANRTTTARATNAANPDSRCSFSRHPRLRGNDERGFPHSDSSLPIPGLPMFFRNLTLFRFPASLDLSDLDDHTAECTHKPVGGIEDRKSVVQGKGGAAGVDLGGWSILKKKTTPTNNT